MDKNLQDDFISTVSHELRTPLTSIRGFSQTMLSSWDLLDDDKKKQFIKIIEEQSNRLINLVENMLSVNKLQTFSDKFIYKSCNAKNLIEPVVQIVAQKYKSHNFNTFYAKNLPDIYVDSDKFQQIMTNLIENAAKYSPENTSVSVYVDFSNEIDFASVKVKDEGIGIKQEDFDKIFNKFSRIDNPLTRKVQGSGLGLYITKTLVTKMGGNINVTSSDKGSVFEVLLPFANIENQTKTSFKELQ
ncbi:HAMP domain-containing histidine kinase [bacterium]|nr:HAMP domain-containing histidine kinase [bacterium]